MATKLKPTKEMILAAGKVFKTMAWIETIKPIVLGYQIMILHELGYNTDPQYSWTLPDDVFGRYNARCKEERDKAKLHVEDDGFCPLLVAEHSLIEAQREMIDLMEPITKLSWDDVLCSKDGLENLEQYKDLTLRMLAPYCALSTATGK